ncbi:hypothetical protein, partial [Candidatus Entotheonella palauensis]|uniref:hypothetical protein n=1 Tax=Candidatus Entotheonella palauensis TaxID=93172 RepID=UPI001C4E1AB3
TLSTTTTGSVRINECSPSAISCIKFLYAALQFTGGQRSNRQDLLQNRHAPRADLSSATI